MRKKSKKVKQIAAKTQIKSVRKSSKKAPKAGSGKIDERLLELPNSSFSSLSKSFEKIKSFSNDLAEKSGITALLGRAVLLRAKTIRQSLDKEKPAKPKLSKVTKKHAKPKAALKNRIK